MKQYGPINPKFISHEPTPLNAAQELEWFLSDHRNVFDLLFDQAISPKKAIEALACYRAGNVPALPDEEAAHPSGASAPQPTHCQECHEVITFNGSYNQWFHADGTSTYPKCTRPKPAPQASAEQ